MAWAVATGAAFGIYYRNSHQKISIKKFPSENIREVRVLSIVAGVDIGNSTTEVCIGEYSEGENLRFLSGASVMTTGAEGNRGEYSRDPCGSEESHGPDRQGSFRD